MAKIHNLGFPRIGAKRELKFAQEKFWKGESSEAELQGVAKDLRAQNWAAQSGLDFVPVGDHSLYDHVLDMSFALGNLPERAQGLDGSELDNYFRVARGRSAVNPHGDQCDCGCNASIAAGEMTKWFDTNYHYIVPEVTAATEFNLNSQRILAQLKEAQDQGVSAKPVIVGPVTYLYLSKEKDASNRLNLLDKILPVYSQLLDRKSVV